jgi:hypothetical protein
MGHMRTMCDGKLYEASLAICMKDKSVYAGSIHKRCQLVLKRLGSAERVAKLRSDLFFSEVPPLMQDEFYDYATVRRRERRVRCGAASAFPVPSLSELNAPNLATI